MSLIGRDLFYGEAYNRVVHENPGSATASATGGLGSVTSESSSPHEFAVSGRTVTDRAFANWVSKMAKARDISKENHSVEPLKSTTLDELTEQLGSASALSAGELNAVIDFLQAKVDGGAKLQVADWGDASAEWLGKYVVAHKPGDAKAVVLDLVVDKNE
jgi:hypothetical protein